VKTLDGPQPTAWITLVDGSVLAADKFTVDAADLSTTGLGGVFLAHAKTGAVRAVRFSKPDDPSSLVWPEKVGADAAADLLAVRKKDHVDFLEGRLGEVTDAQVSLKVDGENIPANRTKIDGLIYFHKAGNELPPPLCVVETNSGWRLNAKSISWLAELPPAASGWLKPAAAESSPKAAGTKEAGTSEAATAATNSNVDQTAAVTDTAELTSGGWLKVVTQSDAEVYVPWNSVVRLDVSSGKIVYLSDLDPESVNWTPYLDFGGAAPSLAQFYSLRRNESREHEPLQMGNKTYAKGLSIYSRTAVVYRLPSGMKRFKATVGIDDAVRDSGRAKLEISADGKKLFERAINGKDAPQELDFDIAGAKRLTILVDYGESQDLGDYVDLVDARTLK
ncbi:MAG TPA: NPCBM/NEW2 domain-containing protein, partial [Pirellulales bacterium]